MAKAASLPVPLNGIFRRHLRSQEENVNVDISGVGVPPVAN